MSAYNKFYQFISDVHRAVHNFTSDATCTLTVALTDAANAPVATDSVLADLVQIAYTNLSPRVVGISSEGQVLGVEKIVVNDLLLSAAGGQVAPFRYVVLYNDDPISPADPLICWYDYGSNITLLNGETLLLDFSAVNGLFQHT